MTNISDARIPIYRPWMDDEEAQALSNPILAGWVTQGPEVAAFEEEFSAFVGAQDACAVSSGTSALQLALQVAGVGPGDEVITVSHSFIATSNTVILSGATPRLVDIELDTLNIDPEQVLHAITPGTRAILAVHQVGMPCDLRALSKLAREHDLVLIEDAACAAGSEIEWNGTWEKLGKPHGDLACFSFHPRKLLTTGEGGMVTSRDPRHAEQLVRLRNHGLTTDASGVRAYTEIGYNFRMNDLEAAVGRVQLRRLPKLLDRRRYQVQRYRELLADVADIEFQREPDWARSNWQSLLVRLPPAASQNQVIEELSSVGVSALPGIMCSHREPAYREALWRCAGNRPACSCQPGSCRRLENSEKAQDTYLALPLFHEMTEAQQDRVVGALRQAIDA